MKHIVVLEGAMGTELLKKGLTYKEIPTSSVNYKNIVKNIHQAYKRSGADVILSNTFSLARIIKEDSSLARDIIMAEEEILYSLNCIKESVISIGPFGDTKNMDELKEVYFKLNEIMRLSTIDTVFLETQYIMDETIITLKSLKGSSKKIFLSFAINEKGYLYSGEKIKEIINTVKKYDIAAIGFNCSCGTSKMISLVRQLKKETNLPIIAKPNLGIPKKINGKLIYNQSDESFKKDIINLLDAGTKYIGGCCGTTPRHIDMIRRMKYNLSTV